MHRQVANDYSWRLLPSEFLCTDVRARFADKRLGLMPRFPGVYLQHISRATLAVTVVEIL
jgi:hypothetical protein